MKMQLIGSYPGKRFDWDARLCNDGRGGWTMSQMNVDRCVELADGGPHYLFFCFAVLAKDADKDDEVAATRLIAVQNDKEIGTSEYEWSPANSMWNMHDGDAIFEWQQDIEMHTDSHGLVELSIHVKLRSSKKWVLVNGNAYTRILDTSLVADKECRHASPQLYGLLRMIPSSVRKRFRRK